jgi:hypothetical protein
LPHTGQVYYFSPSHIASRRSILSPNTLGHFLPKHPNGGLHISAALGISIDFSSAYTIVMVML